MNAYTYHNIESLITYQPGMKEEMVAASSADLYRLLIEFKKVARQHGDHNAARQADAYQDRILARI